MNAVAVFLRITILSFFIFGIFVRDASARPDRKRGINFVLTALRITPKEFSKAYNAEKKENARLLKKSRRRMYHRQNGWKLLRFFSGN